MFESLVSNLLTYYLKEYIKALNTDNLNISIWSGNVSLENLELKSRALEKLNLPFTIKEGFLGKLSIKIPWNNLKTEPVIVIIDQLYITASPKSTSQWNEEDEDLLYEKKLKKLKIFEALKQEKKNKQQELKEKKEKRKLLFKEKQKEKLAKKNELKLQKQKQRQLNLQQRLQQQQQQSNNNNNNSPVQTSSSSSLYEDDSTTRGDDDTNVNTDDTVMDDDDDDELFQEARDYDDDQFLNKNEFIDDSSGIGSVEYQDDEDDEEEEEEEEEFNEDEEDDQDEIYKNVVENQPGEEPHSTLAASSFTEKLRNKIVDNLQIMIYNVHVRFEDSITNPESPYCFGVTLEHLLARSCNEEWKPSFIHTPHTLVHKLINLQNLSVYWDAHTKDPNLNYKSINEFKSLMTKLIPTKLSDQSSTSTSTSTSTSSSSSTSPQHNYLLHPVCGSLKLLINKSIIPNKYIPLYTANFEFDEINLELESKQYSGILALVDWFTMLKKGEKYRKFKPKSNNGILKTSKDRWNFATTCILEDVRDKIKKWTPKFFDKRRKDRLDYIYLFKLLKKSNIGNTVGSGTGTGGTSGSGNKSGIIISESNLNRLNSLEKEYSFEDLVYFRSLADAQLKAENDKNIISATPPKVLSPKLKINNNSSSSDNNSESSRDNNKESSTSSNIGSTSSTSSSSISNNNNVNSCKKQIEIIDKKNKSTVNNNNSKNSNNNGWFKWLGWGGSGGNKSKSNQIQNDYDENSTILNTLELTDQQKRELYSTIEYDEHQTSKNIVYPKDYVKTRINFTMNRGSIAFRLKPPTSPITHFSPTTKSSSNKSADLLIELVRMSVGVDKFVGSLYVQAILETIYVRDFFTENTQFPILMKPIVKRGNGGNFINSSKLISSYNNSEGIEDINKDYLSIVSTPTSSNSPSSSNNNQHQHRDNLPIIDKKLEEKEEKEEINQEKICKTLDCSLNSVENLKKEKQEQQEQQQDDDDYLSIDDDNDEEDSGGEYEDTNDIRQPLFSMTLQQNPLQSDSDFSIFIEALPLEVVYNKSMMDAILEFFGNAPSNTLKEIEEAARNQIKIFKDKTTLRIQYELQNHKSVDLDININAPHVLIPESFTIPSSPILVLDLGSFSLQSVVTQKPSSNDHHQHNGDGNDSLSEEIEISSILKNNQSLNDQQQQQSNTGSPSSFDQINLHDEENVNKYLYDLFELKLLNIQFYIASQGESIQLVEKFDINFKIYKCIIKSQTLLTKLKLFGSLPCLNMFLSPKSIEILIKIISTLQNDPPEISSHLLSGDSKNNLVDETLVNNSKSSTTINIETFHDINIDEIDNDNNGSGDGNGDNDEENKNNTTTTTTTTNELLEQTQDQLPILMIYNTILEVSFSIPIVSLQVVESGRPFIKLILSDINSQVLKRTFDTTIHLSLKKLLIQDLYQNFKNENFKYLANSSNINGDFNEEKEEKEVANDDGSGGDEQHLIKISISSVQNNSPQYTGVSQEIDVSFNTLFININKKLIIKIINLVEQVEKTIVETVLKRRESRKIKNEINISQTTNTTTNTSQTFQSSQSSQSSQPSQQPPPQQPPPSQPPPLFNNLNRGFEKPKFQVDKTNSIIIITTKMKSLVVHLNEDDQSLFELTVSDLSINFDIDLQSSMMRFKLGNLMITDISKDASKDLNPLFGTDGEHIIEFYVYSIKNIIKSTPIITTTTTLSGKLINDDQQQQKQQQEEQTFTTLFEKQDKQEQFNDDNQSSTTAATAVSSTNELPLFDTKIGVRMSFVKLILVRSLVDRIIDYFEEFAPNQIDQIISDSAKGAVEIMSTRHINQQKRVLFEIDVNTPRIIFPKNHCSPFVIIADLGHISVFNKYQMVNQLLPSSPLEQSSSSEQVFVYASSINFHSCKFQNGKVQENSIEPISNKINIHVNIESFLNTIVDDDSIIMDNQSENGSNVSSDGGSQIEPKQKVDGEISPIALKVSDQQYTLIISIIKSLIEPSIKQKKRKKRNNRKIINQLNLDNLYQNFLNVANSNKHQHNNASDVGVGVGNFEIPSTQTDTSSQVLKSQSKFEIKDQISFHLPQISLEFFRKNKESVVSFEIDEFEFSLIEYENGNEYTTVSLGSIDLTDTRKSTNNHFRRIIHHHGSNGSDGTKDKSKIKKELQAYIFEKRNGDTQVKILLDNFRGVVVPESLISMIDFILPGIKALSSLSEISPISSPSLNSHSIDFDQSHHPFFGRDPLKSPVKAMLEEKNKKSSGSNVVVHIETSNIEISFIDNPSLRESKLIQVKGSMLGKFNIQKCEPLTYKDFQLSFDKFELFKCRADAFEQTIESIIDPFSVTTNISLVQGKDYLPIDILIGVDPMHISISFQDLLLFTSISKNIESLILNLLNITNGNNGNNNGGGNDSKLQQPKLQQQNEIIRINFQSSSIDITVINDYGNKYCGIVDVKFGNISVEVASDRVLAGLFLSANYFNISKSVWEPLVEEWGFKVGYESIKSQIEGVVETDNIVLSSNQKLNLNITKPLFDTINETFPLVQSVIDNILKLSKTVTNTVGNNKGSGDCGSGVDNQFNNNLHSKSQNFHPFLLKNQTGLEIKYQVVMGSNSFDDYLTIFSTTNTNNLNNFGSTTGNPVNFKNTISSGDKILKSGDEIYLDLKDTLVASGKHGEADKFRSINNAQKFRDITSISLFRINIMVVGFETISNLPIHKTGIYVCNLIPSNNNGSSGGSNISGKSKYQLPSQQLVFEIKVLDSSKVLTVRSNVLIVNETDHTLEYLDKPSHLHSKGNPFIIESKQSKSLSLYNSNGSGSADKNHDSIGMIFSFRPLILNDILINSGNSGGGSGTSNNNNNLLTNQKRWTPPLDCNNRLLHSGTLLFDCPPNRFYCLQIDQHLSNYQIEEQQINPLLSNNQDDSFNTTTTPTTPIPQHQPSYHHINNQQYFNNNYNNNATENNVGSSNEQFKIIQEKRTNHIIKIVAPLVVNNQFTVPIDIVFYDQESNNIVGKEKINQGISKGIYSVNIERLIMIKIFINGFGGGWSEYIQINQSSLNYINKQQRKINSPGTANIPFYINIYQNELFGSIQICLYPTFIILNEIGLNLNFKLNNFISNASSNQSTSGGGSKPLSLFSNISKPSNNNNSGSNDGNSTTILKIDEKIDFKKDPRNWYKQSDDIQIKTMFSPISSNNNNNVGTGSGNGGVGNIHQLLLQVDNSSEWSEPIPIQLNKQESINIIKNDKYTGKSHSLQYLVSTSQSNESLTKIITISPQFILVNNLTTRLYYCQKDSNLYQNYFIEPNETIPFHFMDEHVCKKISFKLSNKNEWSGCFNINRVISFNIKLDKPTNNNNGNNDNDSNSNSSSDTDPSNDLSSSSSSTTSSSSSSSSTSSSSSSSSSPLLYSLSTSSTLDDKFYLPMIQILQEKGIYFVIINPETKDYPPYIIENLTSIPIAIRQVDSNDQPIILYSNHSKRYVWNNPMGTKRLLITIPNTNYKKNVSLDKLQYHQPFQIKYSSTKTLNIRLEIFANGPTNILRLIDLNDDESISKINQFNNADKLSSNNNNNILGGGDDNIKTKNNQQQVITYDLNFEIFIGGLNVSIIDSVPKELLFITLVGLQIRFKEIKTEQNINLSIHSFKVDNQLYHTPYPVMISSYNSNNNKPTKHSLNVSLIRSSQYQPKELHQVGIEYIKELKLDVEPIQVEIDETLLFHLVSFIKSIKLPTTANQPTTPTTQIVKIQKIYSNLPIPISINSKRLYIELLYLPLVDIKLSYKSSPHSRPMIGVWASSAFSAIANIDKASLRLSSWKLEHQFITATVLGLELLNHYKWEVSKILLYSDIFGAPLSLAENIHRGLNDFINESSAGLNNPQDFGKGLVKGTKSLFANSLYGIFNSASKLSNTIGTAIAPFSMDENYLAQRDLFSRHIQQPKHVFDGVSNGIEKFSQGLALGISGLVEQPVREFQDQGFSGLVKGIGKGLIGTFVKPAVGAIDMINSTSQGIRNSYLDTSLFKTRSRPPRFIGPDSIIRSFSFEKSFWQQIIKTTTSLKNRSLYWINSKEWYIIHFKIYDDKKSFNFIIISTIYFYLFDSNFNLILNIKLWDLQLSLKQNDDRYLSIQEIKRNDSPRNNPTYILLLDKDGKSISFSLLNSIHNIISTIKMDQTYFVSN